MFKYRNYILIWTAILSLTIVAIMSFYSYESRDIFKNWLNTGSVNARLSQEDIDRLSEVGELKFTVNKLTEENEELRHQIEELQSSNSEQSEIISDLENNIASKNEEIGQLEEKIAEFENSLDNTTLHNIVSGSEPFSLTASDLYGITKIKDYAFYSSKLESIEIPETVTSIGWHAFEFSIYLDVVTIPSSVTVIGWEAFKYAQANKVYMNANVTTLPSYSLGFYPRDGKNCELYLNSPVYRFGECSISYCDIYFTPSYENYSQLEIFHNSCFERCSFVNCNMFDFRISDTYGSFGSLILRNDLTFNITGLSDKGYILNYVTFNDYTFTLNCLDVVKVNDWLGAGDLSDEYRHRKLILNFSPDISSSNISSDFLKNTRYDMLQVNSLVLFNYCVPFLEDSGVIKISEDIEVDLSLHENLTFEENVNGLNVYRYTASTT